MYSTLRAAADDDDDIETGKFSIEVGTEIERYDREGTYYRLYYTPRKILFVNNPTEIQRMNQENIVSRIVESYNANKKKYYIIDPEYSDLINNTNDFERLLPGPDRMYPDTDSAPIPLTDEYIEGLRKSIPIDISERYSQLKDWGIPEDTYKYLLRNNLLPIMERIIGELKLEPKWNFKVLQGIDTAHRLLIMRNPFL